MVTGVESGADVKVMQVEGPGTVAISLWDLPCRPPTDQVNILLELIDTTGSAATNAVVISSDTNMSDAPGSGPVSPTPYVTAPYYVDIEDLSRKQSGCLYRLRRKTLRQTVTSYDQLENVTLIKDDVVYTSGELVLHVTIEDGWTIRKMYLNHDEVGGLYHLKFDPSWLELDTEGRYECFARAESNRYASWAMNQFQYTLSRKRRNGRGRLVPKYQRYYSLLLSMVVQPCHAMQSTGSGYDDEPRWMICERVTDRGHAYVHEGNFHNKPTERRPWTSLIHAYIHYVYDLSADQTLISRLDCDDHGKISNLVCWDRNRPPYHSRDVVEMHGRVQRAFQMFAEQHLRMVLICYTFGIHIATSALLQVVWANEMLQMKQSKGVAGHPLCLTTMWIYTKKCLNTGLMHRFKWLTMI
ncbi:uncharacterized protein MELLADRAFT_110202 [Melampsora larici-populina 98AG31]|uniref:Alpha-type protein kinase domain-containing protein n=1 Tax=Melampsora larici-populina (strain 98AG31 / pathotype 3-4-7) TaxID=747676 RepID=F4RZ02_MELLP|nr:uncharacterized protein MELLADRAFT_110202 [Melampsora larici-populina 98AG31]EGG02412.1 hypothetical protein MELLADRAFT_110202 [Melampsora larici-populina 98AG31]